MMDNTIRDAQRLRGISEDWRRRGRRSDLQARVLFIAALLTLLLSASVSVWAATRIREGMELVGRSQRLTLALERISARLVDVETGQRGLLLTGDQRFLEPYYAGLAHVDDTLAEARLQLRDPARIARFESLASSVAAATDYLRATVDAGSNGARDEAIARVRSGEGKALLDEVRAQARSLQLEADDLLHARGDALERNAAISLAMSVMAHLALLVFLAGAFITHRRSALLRRRLEDRQSLMVRELNHRVRNNLAAMLAIAEQTMRSADQPAGAAPMTPSEALERFLDAFSGRVRAMGVVHTMLSDRKWEDVDLRELVERILAPYLPGDREEVRISGPTVRAPARAAGPLGATLHELATNAVRHGALSAQDGGELRVRWSVDEAPKGGSMLRLEWKEKRRQSGLNQPDRQGLGADLIRNLATFELGGKSELAFEPDGVRCVVEAPLT